MKPTFVVYIDESGDEGFNSTPGTSDWFVISGVVVRKTHDLQLVKMLDNVRAQLNIKARKPLHFRDMEGQEKLFYVNEIAKSELKVISVLIYKPAIKLKRKSLTESISIKWDVIKSNQISAHTPRARAGLQIADAVAGSFFNAARYHAVNNGDECANLLKGVVYNNQGKYQGYGIKIWPNETLNSGKFAWLLSAYK